MSQKKGSARKPSPPAGPRITNKKARFDYHLLDEFEAGVALLGTEIKAVREGRVQLRRCFCRLEGGPLEKTGVIAGMSGSPVFIDGKLLGAVAYSYPFAKETIAGVTPIGEMMEATRLTTPRAASARFASSIRFNVPSSSSAPKRCQFDSVSNQTRSSASLGTRGGVTGAAIAARAAAPAAPAT